MRHINRVYTQRYNRRRKTDGALCRGRYKSILIDANSYLLQASRYIHRNPIELKKPLVTNLSAYKWSSYPAYLRHKQKPEWLYQDRVYGRLGYSSLESYENYIDQGLDEETVHFYRKKNISSIWGDDDFKTSAYGKAQNLGMEIDGKGLKEPVKMNTIIRQVAEHYDKKAEDIVTARRGQGQKIYPAG